jgi:hypothetical protein
MTKRKGLFEQPTGVWWINYYDAKGGQHRESIGAYQNVCRALEVRERQVREGSFLGAHVLPPRPEDAVFFPRRRTPSSRIVCCPCCGQPLPPK